MFGFRYNKQAFSLVEVIIALGIFAILAAGIFNLATNSYQNFYGTGDKQVIAEYAQEGIEAVRSIRDNSWESIEAVTDQSSQGLVKNSNGYWAFSGSSDTLGSLTRQVQVYSVQRSSTGNIVASSGTNDPTTRKVTVTISGSGISDYQITTYLTDWAYKTWEQTNWNGVGSRYYWTEDNMASSSYSTTTTSTSGEISIAFDSNLPGYGNGYLYSSVYQLVSDEKDLKTISVEQNVPAGCSIQITLEASTFANLSSAESQVYNLTGSYYVSSTPDKLDGKNFLRYFLQMSSCNGYSSTPVLKSVKIKYR